MYPTIEQVNTADQYQICKWYRFLRSPENIEEMATMKRIVVRCDELGGFTPEISKSLGWK